MNHFNKKKLQMNLPLHVHTRSCKKSDDIWSSNNISSRPNFPSFQPCSKGDPTAGFSICAFKHIFVLYEDLRTCAIDQNKCIIQTPNLIIGFRITMVNETCIFCGFKRSKCLKGCFYLWYTVRYNGSKSKHTRFPQHKYFCKSVFCQSLNSYEHCTIVVLYNLI
jgi:hypothetical protein